MNILSVHNSYQQPGGEDEVFRLEAQLLENHGHSVIRHRAHNDELNGKSSFELLTKAIFNSRAYHEVSTLIRQSKPDLMHVHNTFPLLSPAVYYAADEARVPIVQTLHNYRFLCPAGNFFRANDICESCVRKSIPWPAVVHSCYRGSLAASTAAAAVLSVHRLLKTFRKITTYIALSDFACDRFLQAGIPADKLVIKPNFVDPDPGRGHGSGGYCLFVGRLTYEKGVTTLLDAWRQYSPPMDLHIAGDGELANEVKQSAELCGRIHWHGHLEKARLHELMKGAAALIVPSSWFEPFGVVLIEAFAMGIPVIASRIGALTSLVEHGRNGLHFTSGNAQQLAEQVLWLINHPDAAQLMRAQARLEYEKKYTGEQNYRMLMDIYQATLRRYSSDAFLTRSDGVRQPEPALELTQITGTFSSCKPVPLEQRSLQQPR